ncbi:excinuclease ABC subunit UvrA, partial [Candidatus Dependentiae bacterium]|nr:excinuclease ABC subunit UvrA [Candidatus Dependentiae bacterium]
YVRVRINGKIYNIDEAISDVKLAKNKKHNIDILVDRLVIKKNIRTRLTDSVETALKEAEGVLLLHLINGKFPDGSRERIYSEKFMCPICNISFPEISPRLFSFNSPYGACPECSGLGVSYKFDPDIIVEDSELSINNGLFENIGGFGSNSSWFHKVVAKLAKYYKFSLDTPFNKLKPNIKDILLYGSKGKKFKFEFHGENYDYNLYQAFSGVVNILKRRHKQTKSDGMRQYYQQFMSYSNCPACNGNRLKDTALSILVQGKNIMELTKMTIKELTDFFYSLKLTSVQEVISKQILKEIQARLRFLINVGLDYLNLDRKSGTLSGGEAERIKLATQIGSQLVGVIYILDEPTIGLHQRDNKRLLKTLKELRDIGNTLIVVEHDEETILAADNIIDL